MLCARTANSGIYQRLVHPTTRRRLSNGQNPANRDVVIVGGGPVGLALASALGSSRITRESLNVTLIEAGDLSKVRGWEPVQGAFSNRVSSLTNASLAFLNDIGAWNHVDVERTAPVEEMQVWDGISDSRISFNASELELNDTNSHHGQMARLTENLNLQRGLLRHLDIIQHVEVQDKVKVSEIACEERDEGGCPLVHLSDGRILRAKLLVGADGFNSPVRSYAGIPSFGWSYDAQAIVATLFHPPRGAFGPPNTISYQRFLPTGPIAFLPLSPTASSLVWSTKPQLASALCAANPAILASMINAAFRLPEISIRYLHDLILDNIKSETPLTASKLTEEISWREKSHAISSHSAYSSTSPGGQNGVPPTDSDMLPPLVTSIQPGTIASFPLRFNHAESYLGQGAGGRTVFIGDAAHTIHPLAGQGLNLGLADAKALTRCIHDAVLYGGDVGSLTALQPYARERYFKNHNMMAVADKLHKLYSTTFEPIVWARSVGVEVINELDGLKEAIMMFAGGSQPRDGKEGVNWTNLGALGVSSVMTGMEAARVLGNGTIGIVGAGLRGISSELENLVK